jgi:hypothetical protein
LAVGEASDGGVMPTQLDALLEANRPRLSPSADYTAPLVDDRLSQHLVNHRDRGLGDHARDERALGQLIQASDGKTPSYGGTVTAGQSNSAAGLVELPTMPRSTSSSMIEAYSARRSSGADQRVRHGQEGAWR